MKKVPRFWWDYDEHMQIIIESDDPDYKIVMYCPSIEIAEYTLKELREGRLDYKKVDTKL